MHSESNAGKCVHMWMEKFKFLLPLTFLIIMDYWFSISHLFCISEQIQIYRVPFTIYNFSQRTFLKVVDNIQVVGGIHIANFSAVPHLSSLVYFRLNYT